jgi:glutaredoxin-like protein
MEKMISEDIQKQLVEVFNELENTVSIQFFGSKVRACEYCEHTWQLLHEIAEQSEKIELNSFDVDDNPEAAKQFGVELVPGIVIARKEGDEIRDSGVRFAGIPAGHEFSSLINAILLVSKGESGLGENTRSFLAELQQPILMQVFVTTSCPYCPQAVTLAHQMAMESEFVQAEMVEAVEFNELSNRFGVSGVPHTVINAGKGELIGAVPEPMLVDEIKKVIG